MTDGALREAARERVQALLGAEVRGVELMSGGPDHAVLAVRLDREPWRVLAKAYGPAVDGGHLTRTARLSALARDAGAPVPAVLATETAVPSGAWRFLVQEHVEGVPWRQVRGRLAAPELRAAHRALADALLAVQSVRFDAFGEVEAGAALGRAPDLLTALHHRVARRVAGAARRDLGHEVLDREADLFAGADRPVLCHDDLHDANVLFAPTRGRDGTGWRLAGLVDWDKAWAGPAEQDVARMAFWDGMTGPGFWEVYRAAVPPAAGADRRAAVHQLLWCLEYDDPSPRHRTDTAALCRRLGVPPAP